MSHKHPDPHDKKALQREKNLKNWRIFTQTAEQLRQVDSAAPAFEAPAAAAHGESKPWSAQVQQIRDRTTGRRRDAKDRWNRMAGTSGAGAHAR